MFYKETEAQRNNVIIPKSHRKNRLNLVVCDSRAQVPKEPVGCCSETNVRNAGCEEGSRSELKTYRSERLTHRTRSLSGR